MVTLERENFSLDHQHIGQLMAESWELPEYLITAASSHHLESSEVTLQLVANLPLQIEQEHIDLLVDRSIELFKLREEEVRDIVAAAIEEAGSAF